MTHVTDFKSQASASTLSVRHNAWPGSRGNPLWIIAKGQDGHEKLGFIFSVEQGRELIELISERIGGMGPDNPKPLPSVPAVPEEDRLSAFH